MEKLILSELRCEGFSTLETYPVEERNLADFAIEAAADDAGEMGKEAFRVGKEKEDVSSKWQHSNLFGDGGQRGGYVNIWDEAGVPEGVVVCLRHFCFVVMTEKSGNVSRMRLKGMEGRNVFVGGSMDLLLSARNEKSALISRCLKSR